MPPTTESDTSPNSAPAQGVGSSFRRVSIGTGTLFRRAVQLVLLPPPDPLQFQVILDPAFGKIGIVGNPDRFPKEQKAISVVAGHLVIVEA